MLLKKIQVALATALLCLSTVSSPAYADKVICDGNPLCLIAILPLVGLGVLFAKDSPADSASTAIREGNERKLKSLLKSHPELISNDSVGRQLLQQAVWYDKVAAAAMLLDAGLSLSTGSGPSLVRAKSPAMMDLLLQRGAPAAQFDLSQLGKSADTAHDIDMLQRILAHRPPLAPEDAGALALLSARVREHQDAMVSVLLELGINPNGDSNHPALIELAKSCAKRPHDAGCEAETLPLVQMLIKHGVDVNSANTNFSDALACATPIEMARENALPQLAAALETAGSVAEPPAQIVCRTARAIREIRARERQR